MTALFNEIEPFAVAWLRNLSAAGHIAEGHVDDRSIKELQPEDLHSVTQAHFFAGIGAWSYALRLAGWPDDLGVWTGSCPCQPFSAAGKRGGFADDRHLWPEWFRLIRECGPAIIFGEQVASPDGLNWLDAVSTDLEGAGYTFGAVDLCAAGFGAPHIRQRLFFVAIARDERREGLRVHLQSRRPFSPGAEALGSGPARDVADLHDPRPQGRGFGRDGADERAPRPSGMAGRLGDPGLDRAGKHARELSGDEKEHEIGATDGNHTPVDSSAVSSAGAVAGFWGNAEWIPCRDGKYRPVEPGTFPLAHGAPGRVGRLRAYGNAISPWPAAAVIKTAIEWVTR